MQFGLDKLSFSKLQSQALVRGMTNIAELVYLTSSKYAQSAAARAASYVLFVGKILKLAIGKTQWKKPTKITSQI